MGGIYLPGFVWVFFCIIMVCQAESIAPSNNTTLPEVVRLIIKACEEEYKINLEDYKQENGLDESKMCVHKCVAFKTGLMDEKGQLQYDEFKKGIAKSLNPEMQDKIEKCVQGLKLEDNACKTAKNICLCLNEDKMC